MFFTTITALTSLTTLAFAAPTPYRNAPSGINNGTFYIYSSTGGAEPKALNVALINANDNGFYINGLPTRTYCPNTVNDCPDGNVTVLATSGSGTVSMDVQVPGGQQVYIAPDGSLNYTTANSASKPTGSIQTGFKYVSDYGENTFGSLQFSQDLSLIHI